MGHSHYHAAARDRRLEGGKDRRKKRPLTLKQIWSTASSWIEKGGFAIALFLI